MIAVIGDVHGCYYTLRNLLSRIENKYPLVELYATGDMIDRGNFSADVVQLFIEKDIKCVMGNHDYMFYMSMFKDNEEYKSLWAYNSNQSTIESYLGKESLLSQHLEFIGKLPFFYNLDTVFISHAGIAAYYGPELFNWDKMSDRKWEKFIEKKIEEPEGILWNRLPLLKMKKLQIVGHTRQSGIYYNDKTNALYVDTGAYSSHLLSCAVLDEKGIVELISVPTDPRDVQ